jgi:uncharacterized membrane protein
MEAAAALIVIVVFIIIVLPIIYFSNIKSAISNLERQQSLFFTRMEEELDSLKRAMRQRAQPETYTPNELETKKAETPKPTEIITPPIITQDEPKPTTPPVVEMPLSPQPPVEKPAPIIPEIITPPKPIPLVTTASPTDIFDPPLPNPEWRNSTVEIIEQEEEVEENAATDWEKFVGENLINKIGIAILVAGIGFFVKYAIDKDWINEIGRVSIGLGCGGLLIYMAHRIRDTYRAFSSVLVGGGLAILYFTITIAYQEYQLFSQPLAFAIMIGITGLSVALSTAYNKTELAVLSLLGGFASPFMVSNGSGNYIVLFSYILILNGGMLSLAYFRRWNIIGIISFVLTWIIYAGWALTKLGAHNWLLTLVFGALFYILFIAERILYLSKKEGENNPAAFSMMLANAGVFFGLGYYIVSFGAADYKGLFVAALAVINCIFALVVFKKQLTHKYIIYLLVGLVITFLSLIAPIQLQGNSITLFWACEGVLLLWFYTKSGISVIKPSSVLVMMAMLLSLMMDWLKYFPHGAEYDLFINRLFVTGIVCIVSVFLYMRILRKLEDPLFISDLPPIYVANLLIGVMVLLTYIVCIIELSIQVYKVAPTDDAANLWIGIYNFIFVYIAFLFAARQPSIVFKTIGCLFLIACILSYPLVYMKNVDHLWHQYFEESSLLLPWLSHFVLLFLLVLFIINIYKYIPIIISKDSVRFIKYWYWITAVLGLIIISTETLEWISLISGSRSKELLNQSVRIALPILWGGSSFVLMVVGMKRKVKTIRIISLSIFSLTLLKLFIYDIRDISAGGKIAAFIILGILLLIISFMYQKVKKLITGDEEKIVE